MFLLSALVSYFLMGFALAADAGSVSAVYGAVFRAFRLRPALILATAFGLAQGIMPALGWLCGELVAEYVAAIDHWIAFVILLAIGMTFIYDSRKTKEVDTDRLMHPTSVFLCAIATSIDAFAVGFTLFMTDRPIAIPAMIIAGVTFLCSLVCFAIGSRLGKKVGPRLLVFGGTILILIGVRILISHLCPEFFPF